MDVLVLGSPCARLVVPRAPAGPRLLEDLQVPVFSGKHARPFVPGASVGPRPLEDLEVPVSVQLLLCGFTFLGEMTFGTLKCLANVADAVTNTAT